MPAPPARDGLGWDDGGLYVKPIWTREPSLVDIENLCRKELRIDTGDTCAVSFRAEGAFNKLYLIEMNQGKSLLRVSLPVHPHNKTRGEVTTLRFLRDRTDVPVPEVIAFDDSSDNLIGFEWILMEMMPGVSVYKRWRTLTMFQKVALVQRVAELQTQISLKSFSKIGTLKSSDHFDYDVGRGPFRSSYDYLMSYIEIIIKDYMTAIVEAEDEEDKEDAEAALALARRLASLLPKIFPSLQCPPERTVIWHDDLSLQNILVDEQGNITAVVDWECVSATPLWVATKAPKFLEGPSREKEPVRQDYADEDSEQPSAPDGAEDELDNEGKDELYWIHLMEYETTQLRKFYHASMCHLRPGWEVQVSESSLKADFLGAVVRCGDGFHLRRIDQWVDLIEKGECPRLMDVLEEGLAVL
ncbi:hypothetical protein JX265_004473 [Neoarthrinium moseri]|uniref:Aminoglycoside phosphotransferase domain-containing protein n=1 Tax=Neoarthrinium moseri TaxID=1658444 RepID=A0A9Q0AR97_9PEZI|nr:hypothetical protein JX265_004473 [Neoarthrinium moseri]